MTELILLVFTYCRLYHIYFFSIAFVFAGLFTLITRGSIS